MTEGSTTSAKGRPIAPAQGKLGILLPGMGAVATTFIAGVEAIRKGLSRPIGSLTQMGTVRLGKRTDGRNPRISDFVPLAPLKDVVFGGWDIYRDDAYEAAKNLAYRRIANPRMVPIAWVRTALEEQEEVLGPDPWAYGLTPANRKNLETVLRYTHQQGMISRTLPLDALFADTDLGDAGGPDGI